MIAMERGRWIRGMGFALAALGVLGTASAQAQTSLLGGRSKTTAKPAAASPNPARAAAAAPAPAGGDEAKLDMIRIPVNPSDPIALINGEVVTRQQLSDECIVRKGEEILETLIARRLIEQALRARKLEVTSAEIDQEIDNVAMRMAGIGREAWLRTLDKERGISPVQYARDIIYPALALRKLAADRVQVTPDDLKNAFEAQYGDKLQCRIIMVDKLRAAQEIWDELKKNPGGFEKLAQERSMDSGSRSLGGLLAEPITRHAFPTTVSDAAFAQLVDGDVRDSNPAHKPKDFDLTGPIQVAEATWVLIRRERIIPAQKIDPNDANVKKIVYEMIYEVKLKEAMGSYFVDLMKASEIDNRLTGRVKMANEDTVQADGNVRQTSGQEPGTPSAPTPAGAGRAKTPPPAAASAEVIRQTEALQRAPVKK